MKQNSAGYSTCPICGRYWLVTPEDDCLQPACGCYGYDTNEENKYRVCHKCGIKHAMNCNKMNNLRAMDKLE